MLEDEKSNTVELSLLGERLATDYSNKHVLHIAFPWHANMP